MSLRKLLLGVVCLVLVASTPARTADQTLIAAGSLWRYNDSGVDLGSAWRTNAYNHTGWPEGPAQLGYGDGDESTVISYGSSTTNRRITYYFRRSFTVSNPASIAALRLRFVRDDGSVIYLNGQEVVRSNMPSGIVNSTTLATTAIGGADESAWLEASIDPSALAAGTNVLAVEVHQQSPSSSDVSFNLELVATEAPAPVPAVTLSSPAHLSLTNTLEATFAASVAAPAGLVDATLYFKGPRQTVLFSGPSQVQDSQITADSPTAPNGSGVSINVDGQAPHAHGLMKFPTLIGALPGRVPAGATISSAVLQLNCTNSGQTMRLYRLTQDWVEDGATWTTRAMGMPWASPGADGAGSNAGVALAADCTTTGQRLVDVTRFVQEWSDGAPNFGVVITDSGADGIDFSSSESSTTPILTVVYDSSAQPVETRAVSGLSADVSFSVHLPVEQTYFWNVLATDTAGRQGWAATDFQLTVDTSAPDEPLLVSPSNGSSQVDPSAALAAIVSDPANGMLDVQVKIRRAAEPEFTIIALPDTQHYSEAYPAIFTSQTQWIVNNKEARNIVFVTHEGDIVEHYNNTTEWDRALESMRRLDGVVPYGMGPGNHDQPTSYYNQYFPYTRYVNEPWYGGHYQNLNDNNFQLFSGGGMDFVIVHLEFCPPAGAVAWADSVFKNYPDHIGIMTTHGYLNESAQRSVSGCTNTQYLWDGLADNPNLHFMLSGHVHDESRRTDVANGHPVFQMLADYQARASGGEGWLRILRFVPADDKVYVQTFSPWLNRFESDANSEFTLDFPMGGTFVTAGTTSVPSGSTASVTPTTLDPNTTYEWAVTVTNAGGKSRTGPIWTFTTGSDGSINQPPTAHDQSVSVPEDGSIAIGLGAHDPEGNALTYALLGAPAHGILSGTPPGLVYQPAADFSGADSFTFRVHDGTANSNAAIVSITVQALNDAPIAVSESYTMQAGGTLSVGVPGVLGNDTDIDSPSLTAQLVAAPLHGAATLAANGSFSYTPSAGYSGSDSFTYRASDGAATSATTTVNLVVEPPPVWTLVFTAGFDTGQDSFTYVDNTFRGATQSSYASGSRLTSGGFAGGGLQVRLGGLNSTTITNMSGGWRRTFTLSAPATVGLLFRYRMNQGQDYESDELSEVLTSVDGVLTGTSPADFVARVVGNGNGGTAIDTGWQIFGSLLGTLNAGTHTVIVGGFNNKKNGATEQTTIFIDDVTVIKQ